MPAMCDLWWEYHDDNGNLIERNTPREDAGQ